MARRHPYYLQARARVLKYQGDSLSVISEALGVPQSTVWEWVRGMDQSVAMLRYCVKCGDAFLAGRRDAERCPGGCTGPSIIKSTKPARKCAHCGAEYRRPGGTRWCCDEHRDLGKKKAKTRRHHTRVCRWCKVTFITPTGQKRYCCAEHARLARVAARRPERLTLHCPMCGVTFVQHHALQTFCCRDHNRLYHQPLKRERELAA